MYRHNLTRVLYELKHQINSKIWQLKSFSRYMFSVLEISEGKLIPDHRLTQVPEQDLAPPLLNKPPQNKTESHFMSGYTEHLLDWSGLKAS